MSEHTLSYLMGVAVGILLIKNAMTHFSLSFYRGYFREKQRIRGKDPDAVIRAEFPRLWWLL